MRSVIFYIFLILSLGFVVAEETFSVDYTIDYALKHSPRYQMILRDREIARAKAFEGYGAVFPNLELDYHDSTTKLPENILGPTFAKLAGPTANLNPEDIFPTKINTKTTEFKASQLLFSFSGLAAWKASDAALKLAEYSYEDDTQKFLLELRKTYYDLQMAKNIAVLNQKVYEQAKEHAREVNIMYNNQLIARKDYLDARVRELEALQNADTAQKNYQLSQYNFNNLLGREIGDDIKLDTPSITIKPEIVTMDFKVKELIDFAAKQRANYRSFEELVKLAEADDLNALGESLPSLYYIYDKQNNKYDPESQTNGDTETQMLSAGWKFFSGGSNLHKMNEKKNAKERIQEQQKNVRNQLAIEIHNGITELKLCVKEFIAAREANVLAEESLKLAVASFHAGSGTSTQVNDALTQFLAANINTIKAAYDYEESKDNLSYVVGKEIL